MVFTKKAVVIMYLISASYSGLHAQSQVHLSVSYLPKHKYAQKNDQIIHLDLKFSDKKVEKAISGGNMQNPTKQVVTNHNEILTTTGKLSNDTLFPFKMVITKSEEGGREGTIPAGTTVFGNSSTNGNSSFDSIVSVGMDAKLKAKLFTMIKSLVTQITVPERTLKVGDKFTHETPLNLPIAGMEMSLVVRTTYKLKSITNGLANFDINQVLTMKGEMSTATFKAGGTGTGTMCYDIKNRYYTQYNLTALMNMDMKMDGQSISMKMEETSIQNIVITEE